MIVFKKKDTVFREDHFYLCLEELSPNDLEKIGKTVQDIMTKPLKIDGRQE